MLSDRYMISNGQPYAGAIYTNTLFVDAVFWPYSSPTNPSFAAKVYARRKYWHRRYLDIPNNKIGYSTSTPSSIFSSKRIRPKQPEFLRTGHSCPRKNCQTLLQPNRPFIGTSKCDLVTDQSLYSDTSIAAPPHRRPPNPHLVIVLVTHEPYRSNNQQT